MPGPWSRATTTTPWRSPLATTLSATSPRLAYMRMLRAISEIAAAITVWSPLENPASAARSRPRCRAVTTSVAAAMGIRSSSATVDASRAALDTELRLVVEKQQAFLEIQRGGHALEREAELDHGERHLGLNPDDHGLRPAQPRHVGDVPERTYGERIHHVERRDVDDHAPGPEAPDALDQRLTQLGEIRVRERRLDGRNQVMALLQDRDFHASSVDGVGSRVTPSGRPLPAPAPCSRAAARPLRCRPAGRRPSPSRSGPRRSSPASARSRARGPSR